MKKLKKIVYETTYELIFVRFDHNRVYPHFLFHCRNNIHKLWCYKCLSKLYIQTRLKWQENKHSIPIWHMTVF